MKKTKLLAFAFLATMFASCSNDNVPVDENKDTPLTIASAGVNELSTRVITEGQLIGSKDEPIAMSVWVVGSAEK